MCNFETGKRPMELGQELSLSALGLVKPKGSESVNRKAGLQRRQKSQPVDSRRERRDRLSFDVYLVFFGKRASELLSTWNKDCVSKRPF